MKSFTYTATTALSGSFTGTAFDCSEIDTLSFQWAATTSANTGQFAVQVSNDGTNWDVYAFDPVIPPLAGANAVVTASVSGMAFKYAREKFTIGTGTNGTVTTIIYGKGK